MTGRVLSEEDLQQITFELTEEDAHLGDEETVLRCISDLIATIRFHERIKKVVWEQNTIFLKALEHISEIPLTTRESAIAIGFNAALEDCQTIAREALAKVRGDE